MSVAERSGEGREQQRREREGDQIGHDREVLRGPVSPRVLRRAAERGQGDQVEAVEEAQGERRQEQRRDVPPQQAEAEHGAGGDRRPHEVAADGELDEGGADAPQDGALKRESQLDEEHDEEQSGGPPGGAGQRALPEPADADQDVAMSLGQGEEGDVQGEESEGGGELRRAQHRGDRIRDEPEDGRRGQRQGQVNAHDGGADRPPVRGVRHEPHRCPGEDCRQPPLHPGHERGGQHEQAVAVRAEPAGEIRRGQESGRDQEAFGREDPDAAGQHVAAGGGGGRRLSRHPGTQRPSSLL